MHGTTFVFGSVLFSSLSMRAFGSCILMSPMVGAPFISLTISSLSAFDYTSKSIFFHGKAGCWFVGKQVIFEHLQNVPSTIFAYRVFFESNTRFLQFERLL